MGTLATWHCIFTLFIGIHKMDNSWHFLFVCFFFPNTNSLIILSVIWVLDRDLSPGHGAKGRHLWIQFTMVPLYWWCIKFCSLIRNFKQLFELWTNIKKKTASFLKQKNHCILLAFLLVENTEHCSTCVFLFL